MDAKFSPGLTVDELLAPRRPMSRQDHLRIRGLMVRELQRLQDEMHDLLRSIRSTDADRDPDITGPLVDRRDELDGAIGLLLSRLEAHDEFFGRQERAAARRSRNRSETYTHGYVPDAQEAEIRDPGGIVSTTSFVPPPSDEVRERDWPGEPRGFDPKMDC